MTEIQRNEYSAANPPAIGTRDHMVGKLIYRINQIRAYPMSAADFIEWLNTLNRIKPDIDVKALGIAVDLLLSGELEYDEKQGIRNLFRALQRVGQDEDGKYIILKPL